MPSSYTAEYWDHRRDHLKHEARPIDERYAVADLVGYCEGLISSGLLGIHIETELRQRVAVALTAFNMPSKPERDHA